MSGVRFAYVYKAVIRRRVTGDAGINPSRRHALRKLSGAQNLALASRIRSRPGITLAQAVGRAWCRAQHRRDLECGRRLGLSIKKALGAAEQGRPDVAGRPALCRAAQPFLDPESLVFLDETGVNTKMARLYGWAPAGERCRDKAPFGHWKTMTFVAGLRLSGMIAPWVLDRAMDGDAFRMYVQHVLAPPLKPGDVVVLETYPPTKWLSSARRSPTVAPRYSTCRPTAQI
jgi:hypothetical protein